MLCVALVCLATIIFGGKGEKIVMQPATTTKRDVEEKVYPRASMPQITVNPDLKTPEVAAPTESAAVVAAAEEYVSPDEQYRKSLYEKTEKHADLCKSVCGVRYDKIEIRGAAQTPNYDSVVVCLDTSAAEMKNGQSYDDARTANDCNETHGDWCITYNKRYDGVDLGVYAQCAGLNRT
jgi:hypothetical protein